MASAPAGGNGGQIPEGKCLIIHEHTCDVMMRWAIGSCSVGGAEVGGGLVAGLTASCHAPSVGLHWPWVESHAEEGEAAEGGGHQALDAVDPDPWEA